MGYGADATWVVGDTTLHHYNYEDHNVYAFPYPSILSAPSWAQLIHLR